MQFVCLYCIIILQGMQQIHTIYKLLALDRPFFARINKHEANHRKKCRRYRHEVEFPEVLSVSRFHLFLKFFMYITTYMAG